MGNGSNYYDIYEEYGLKHYQIPKVFFTSALYKALSTDAKLAWAILRDRFTLSKQNGWFEKDTGRIYFIFTNKQLMDILNVKSETTVTNIKKTLVEAGLLAQKRMGLNSPNRLYLLKPTVVEKDVYEISILEEAPEQKDFEPQSPKKKQRVDQKNGTPKNEVPLETLDTEGTSKNEVPTKPLIHLGTPKNEVQEPQKMESNDTEYSDTDFISLKTDTRDTCKETMKEDLSTDYSRKILKKQKEKERLQDELLKESLKSHLPEGLHKTLAVFSEDYDEMYRWVGTILRAKDRVSKELGELLLYENEGIEFEINKVLLSGIRAIRKNRNIENPENYLFITLYNGLTQLVQEMKRAGREGTEEKGEAIPMYNWLDD